MKTYTRCAAALAVAFLFSAGAWAQDDMPMEQAAQDQQAMMEAWATAATPGEEHAWLSEMAGTFNVESTWWMAPGAQPMTSTGTAEREMILGGRVLRESFSSDMMGQTFEGVAHIGYDNVTDTFWNTWTDNMSTGLSTGEGECADDRSKCTWTLTGSDPMTGGTSTFHIEIVYGDNQETHSFHENRGGEDFKSMEMVYTRAD